MSEWIPCKDRLPDYYTLVLTYDGGAYCVEQRIPFIYDDEGNELYNDWWVDEDGNEYYPKGLRDGAAIAWMPLPKPYKADKD